MIILFSICDSSPKNLHESLNNILDTFSHLVSKNVTRNLAFVYVTKKGSDKKKSLRINLVQ